MTKYIDFAEYYDLDHDVTIDVDFYREFAARCGSPVLELACGTGRVVIPLAEGGFEVYGVDISANMLDICRRRVQERGLEGRVHLVRADMVDFELPRHDFKFAFVALRSFMHLVTTADQLACLRQLHRHLRPGAHLILDVIAPELERLAEPPADLFALRREFDMPGGRHVLRRSRLAEHDRVNQVRRFEFRFEEYDDAGRLVRERLVPLDMRYIFRYELQFMLNLAGFEVVDVYRDYAKNAYDGTGEMLVVAHRGGERKDNE